MQDRPDADELLEAVGTYLFGELRPLVPREHRFKVLVAANLCAVVARELRLGDEADRADAKLFAELIGDAQTDAAAEPEAVRASAREAAAELAGRIRQGAHDGELDAVLERLAAHVRRKLEIARPDYPD